MEMVPGTDIGLPLIGHIGTLRSHSASPTQTWHSHHGFEFLFMTGGATAWDFQGGRTVEVTGGHFLIVPPGAIHRSSRGMRRPSNMCGILFSPDCPNGWKNSTFTKRDLQWLADHFPKKDPTIAIMGRELTSRINRLTAVKRAFEADPRNRTLQAALRTLACSVILEAAHGLFTPAVAGPAAIINAAKEYLNQHLREPVPMSALVRRVGFSRSHLFAIFKSVTGMTPNDYYLRIRIEKAQQLLARSDCQVTDVALETGFSSSQYFSSVFRKYTGQTPVEYRNKSMLKTARVGCMKSSTKLFRKT